MTERKLIGSIYFDNIEQIPRNWWRWPNFHPKELRSKGNGGLLLSMNTMDKLQRFRTAWGAPMIVFSAYRDHEHNIRVGGAPESFHRQGRAFDITTRQGDKQAFIDIARQHGFTGIGRYDTFVHVDDGPEREW